MVYVVRSGTVRRHGTDGRPEPPVQVVVAQHASVRADTCAHALDAAMSALDNYRVVHDVDGSAFALLHALAFAGKREVLLVVNSPHDVEKVLERVAALQC